MSAHVLLNLLNELWKSDEMRGLRSSYIVYIVEYKVRNLGMGGILFEDLIIKGIFFFKKNDVL